MREEMQELPMLMLIMVELFTVEVLKSARELLMELLVKCLLCLE